MRASEGAEESAVFPTEKEEKIKTPSDALLGKSESLKILNN